MTADEIEASRTVWHEKRLWADEEGKGELDVPEERKGPQIELQAHGSRVVRRKASRGVNGIAEQERRMSAIRGSSVGIVAKPSGAIVGQW